MATPQSGTLWPTDEQRLLLAAGLLPGERAEVAFRAWRSRIDPDGEFGWNTLRLLPLVYQNLHAQRVTDSLMARLKGMYRRAWCETHQLFHQTAPVVARLAQECEVLLLKGVPLVLSYYRNYALRPMADLDIWIRRSQRSRAIEILQAEGYVMTEDLSDDAMRFRHAIDFVRPGGGCIDLHWHVLYEAAEDRFDDAIWRRSEPIEFQGIPLRQPDPTTMLVNVILHGVRWNEESPVRWIPDALTVLRVRGAEIDWSRLVSEAQSWKVTYRLGLGLKYLRDAFEAAIPPQALLALERPPSVLELIENSVLLADGTELGRNPLASQWVAFSEYCRYAEPGGPLAFLTGFSHFLRVRWGLSGRREIVPRIVRGMRRRMQPGSVPSVLL